MLNRFAMPDAIESVSLPAAVRIGPEPIAKNLPTLICQPAYWLAMQAAIGWSVATAIAGPDRAVQPGSIVMRPRPAMHVSAKARPASNPPAAEIPQSITVARPIAATRTAVQPIGIGNDLSREGVQRRSLRFT